MNKARSRAYNVLMSGARYHEPNISRLTIGYRRGTLKALKDDYRELCRRIQRITQCKPIQFFAAWVMDSKDGSIRRHAHIIWTSPMTRWKDVHPIFQEIVGDNCTCWIDEIEGMDRHKLGYVLQYLTNQKGEHIRYSKSLGWLPEGCETEWRKIKGKHRAMNSPLSDAVCELNNWIDLMKTRKADTTIQSVLFGMKSGVPRRRCDVYDASLQVDRRPFVKRRI